MNKARPSAHFFGFLAAAFAIPLSGCSLISAAGPTKGQIGAAQGQSVAGADIRIVDVTDEVARRTIASSHSATFSESLGDGLPLGAVIGKGDVLDIAIWEAPPAALFGTVGGDTRLTTSNSIARSTLMPEQMVNGEGRITIPFAGSIVAAGRTPQQIESEITARLIGKAHQPQVVVRLVRNVAANVTVVGEVSSSALVPLTAKGERLLDILASVGGVKQPVGKVTIQITRGDRVVSLPLETVIRDPHQNIKLEPNDVVTALFQPFSFTALGATGRNEELPFEATGLTLAQALGRVAGLQDQRADVKGVFVFRLEDPAALGLTPGTAVRTTPDGRVPVIYRVNMKDPATFFIAQGFPIRNKDVLYVSNAPLADVQKFVSVISSTILPVATVSAIVP